MSLFVNSLLLFLSLLGVIFPFFSRRLIVSGETLNIIEALFMLKNFDFCWAVDIFVATFAYIDAYANISFDLLSLDNFSKPQEPQVVKGILVLNRVNIY